VGCCCVVLGQAFWWVVGRVFVVWGLVWLVGWLHVLRSFV
jgi:hypothetical protein